jgi:hypothetical protein
LLRRRSAVGQRQSACHCTTRGYGNVAGCGERRQAAVRFRESPDPLGSETTVSPDPAWRAPREKSLRFLDPAWVGESGYCSKEAVNGMKQGRPHSAAKRESVAAPMARASAKWRRSVCRTTPSIVLAEPTQGSVRRSGIRSDDVQLCDDLSMGKCRLPGGNTPACATPVPHPKRPFDVDAPTWCSTTSRKATPLIPWTGAASR